MRRVALTYEPFRRHFPGEPVIIPELREIDFGDWTGFGWNDVEQRFGMSAYNWLHHLEQNHVQGAESIDHFLGRLGTSLDQILSGPGGRTVAVFCHGGVIRGLLSRLLSQPLRWFEHVEIDYAGVTWVDVGISKGGNSATKSNCSISLHGAISPELQRQNATQGEGQHQSQSSRRGAVAPGHRHRMAGA
jgi:broad specificity phosphatase PhoE